MSEQPSAKISPDGKFPGWAAVVGMLVCPLIGLFIVGLTTWKMRSKVLVGTVGCILWIAAFALMILNGRAGPTGA